MIKIVDNFYSDPDSILSLLTDQYNIKGCGSGKRTTSLQELDQNLFFKVKKVIFDIHGIEDKDMLFFTFFNEHVYNPVEVFNHNWVHMDGKNPQIPRMVEKNYRLILAGKIFLNPEPDLDCDIELCRVKPELNFTRQELMDKTLNNYTTHGKEYREGRLTLDEFQKIHDDYHANFDTTVVVKNVYNRMVSWPAGLLNGARNNKNMPSRITQSFYIQSKYPISQWACDSSPRVNNG